MTQQHVNAHPSHSKKLTEGSGSIAINNTNQVKQIKATNKFNVSTSQGSPVANGLSLPAEVTKKANFEI